MGLTFPSNKFIWGISKQTNEGTVATTEEYGMPVFSGRSKPVQSTQRIEVTDAAAIAGDPFKQPISWDCDVVVPAFAASLGRLLTSLWPTDTKTGAGPYTHTMSGLGSTTPWFTTYNTDLLAGAVEETFEAGQATGITFSGDATQGPLRVGLTMVGKRPTIASYTNATPESQASGWFTAAGGTMKYEVDSGTPATETNIESFAVNVARGVEAVPTVDAVSVAYLALGKVDPTFTMTLLMDDHEAYRATFYGAVGGSTPSTTIVKGSVELNFVHTVQAGWSFKITIPSAVLFVEPPQPDPAGAPLRVTVNGVATVPGAGDHVQPVLINAVSTTY